MGITKGLQNVTKRFNICATRISERIKTGLKENSEKREIVAASSGASTLCQPQQ